LTASIGRAQNGKSGNFLSCFEEIAMSRRPRRGINWLGVLVILVLIVVVIGLIIPAPRRIAGAAERMRCMNNLKQLMLAFHNYYDDMGVKLPVGPAGDLPGPVEPGFPTGCLGRGTVPEQRLGWPVALLPYLEQEALFKKLDPQSGYAPNESTASVQLPVFLCPSAKDQVGGAVSNYVTLAGIGPGAAAQPLGASGNGFMGFDRRTSIFRITDGTSNTIALMETRRDPGPWARGGSSTLRGFDPQDALTSENPPFAGHGEIVNSVTVDCSVKAISTRVDLKILSELITIAGGESPSTDW
jgi:hypothetical protein